ncbi:MAG TPA: DUF1572 family protein [Bryobacteraceae bacterium]|nr:DUF1572 family protein [Bryobacteraceae bacterium]
MNVKESALAEMIRKDARDGFGKYLPRIVRCLQLLTEEEIWWRPNSQSNAAGNIVLHLCGNLRQWVIAGLGGAPDVRERDKEFSERNPISRRKLIRKLRETVGEACEVIDGISARKMTQEFPIQGYRVSGMVAILHVYEHFAYHAGQMTYLTKLKRGRDLKFTRLPARKSAGSPTKTAHR